MTFAFFLLIVAVLLLANIKKLEQVSNQYELIKKTTTVNYNHAHNLVVDLGDTLINTEGAEQYHALKPKLEQVKRYYLNNENQKIHNVVRNNEDNRQPVALKIVS